MNRRTLVFLPVLAALTTVLGGCPGTDGGRWLTYVFLGGDAYETIQAEFSELQGKTVAVVIYASDEILFEYYQAPRELASTIGANLKRNVTKKLIAPEAVIQYQQENPDWDRMERTRLGKQFGADYVLLVTLMEFTTREPGSSRLFRGRITAEVTVWDTSKPEADARFEIDPSLSVVHPEKTFGNLIENDAQARYDTERKFAQLLVRKFYDHKIKREQ